MYLIFWLLLSFVSVLYSPEALGESLALNFKNEISQEDYLTLVRDVSNSSRFSLIAPPSSVGYGNFEVAVAGTAVALGDSRKVAEKNLHNGQNFPKTLWVTRALLQTALQPNLDVSLSGGFLPYSKLFSVAGGVQYGIIAGPDPLPNVSARVGYSALFGGKKLSVSSTNLELLGSLHIKFLEPYLGVGFSYSSAASSYEYVTLRQITATRRANWTDVYLIAGASVAVVPSLSLNLEAQISSVQNPLQARLSYRF